MQRIPSFRTFQRKVQFSPGIRTAYRTLHLPPPFIRKMRHVVSAQVSAARGEPEAGNKIEVTEEFGRFVPRVPDQPFVCAFASEHHFLSAAMNFSGELEQR